MTPNIATIIKLIRAKRNIVLILVWFISDNVGVDDNIIESSKLANENIVRNI